MTGRFPMPRNRWSVTAALIVCLVCPSAHAQEGHPLEGIWQGVWGETAGARNFLTLVLHWDGQAITGEVNPGRYAGRLRAVTLDSATWTVHLDLDVTDRRTGDESRLQADGRILKIGRPDRMILGELQNAGGNSHLKLTRQ